MFYLVAPLTGASFYPLGGRENVRLLDGSVPRVDGQIRCDSCGTSYLNLSEDDFRQGFAPTSPRYRPPLRRPAPVEDPRD